MIDSKVTDEIGIIEFDSVKGNMMSLEDLTRFIEIVDGAKDLKGLVLTGHNKSFCTGLMVESEDKQSAFLMLDKLLIRLFDYPKPMVSLLSGHAIGAGFLYLCCCDYVIANCNLKAKFGMPEVKLGLGIDSLMLTILRYSLSENMIKNLLLTSRYMDIKELFRTGMVNIYDDKAGLESCFEFINSHPYPKAYSWCKLLLHKDTSNLINYLWGRGCYKELLSIDN